MSSTQQTPTEEHISAQFPEGKPVIPTFVKDTKKSSVFDFWTIDEWGDSIEILGPDEGNEALVLRSMRHRFEALADAIERKKSKGRSWIMTTLDDRYYKDVRYAITKDSWRDFSQAISQWYRYVSTHIKRWDRKKKIEKFRADGTIDGIWGSPFGDKVAQMAPSYCGIDMEKPPVYYDVMTPTDHRLYTTFEMEVLGPFIRHTFTWFFLAYGGAIATQLYSQYSNLRFLPSFFRRPFYGVPLAIVSALGPGYLTYLFNLTNRRRYAMDHFLTAQGCFLAAKSRLIADEIMWPSEKGKHNRYYLEMLPRDKWDEFVWNNDDDSIAYGTFPKQWDWARKENQPKEIDFWNLSKDAKQKCLKGLFKELIIGRRYEWSKTVIEIQNTSQKTEL